MANETIITHCAIAGGGPAGMMLGFLLARAGVDVLVLEKHTDFLRDFRGDTIHPSTLEVMYELGLLEDFLKRPHQQADELRGLIGDDRPQASTDPLQVHRAHAAMGLPRLPCRSCQALFGLRLAHACRCRRATIRWRKGRGPSGQDPGPRS